MVGDFLFPDGNLLFEPGDEEGILEFRRKQLKVARIPRSSRTAGPQIVMILRFLDGICVISTMSSRVIPRSEVSPFSSG